MSPRAVLLLCLLAALACSAAVESFPLLTGENFTEASYVQFIDNIRAYIGTITTNQAHGITLLPSTAQTNKMLAAQRYFLVELTNDNAERQVTVAVRLQNLYVVGYRYGPNSYFFDEEYDSASPVLFAGTIKNKLLYNGTYDTLKRRAGAGRADIDLGNWALSGAIDNLAYLKPGDDETQAKAFTVIIQVLSEAVRFQCIQTKVSKAVDVNFRPSNIMCLLENKWSELSKAVIKAGEDGIINPPVTIGKIVVSTVQQAALELKIALNSDKVAGDEVLEADLVFDTRGNVAGSGPEEE